MLDYPTRIQPEREGQFKQTQNRDVMMQLLGDECQLRRIPSYRFGPLLGILDEVHASNHRAGREVQYIFDITCLTKLHTLALAYWLTTTPKLGRVLLAYSRPEDYGSPIRKVWDKGAWLEVLVAPFDIDPEPEARGVVGIGLPGHQGDRLRLALHDVPLDAGVIVVTESDDPRVGLVTEAQNRWLFDDIARQKDPAPVSLVRVAIWDMARLKEIVDATSDNARKKGMRLMLYPFGPKSLILGTSIFALSRYLLGTWYAYPIPRTYDLDYTVGVGTTYWAALTKTQQH
ncbi:MAG: hypothetical protein FJ291_03365 [Planctomycetes bacterium]|nr:hypothetical protein [Planctomycetota bacterium]